MPSESPTSKTSVPASSSRYAKDAACAADALDKLGIIPLVLHPIDIGFIDDQQRRGIVVIEEQRIGIVETLQIGRFHQTLVGDAALLDALEQHPDRRLQIDL